MNHWCVGKPACWSTVCRGNQTGRNFKFVSPPLFFHARDSRSVFFSSRCCISFCYYLHFTSILTVRKPKCTVTVCVCVWRSPISSLFTANPTEHVLHILSALICFQSANYNYCSKYHRLLRNPCVLARKTVVLNEAVFGVANISWKPTLWCACILTGLNRFASSLRPLWGSRRLIFIYVFLLPVCLNVLGFFF